MESTIVPADTAYRKTVLIVAVIFALVAVVCVQTIHSVFEEIETLAQQDPEAALSRAGRVVGGITLLNYVVSIVFALYFVSIAVRTIRAEQYPPPGLRVIKDTKLREGTEARRMALALLLVAGLILSTNGAMWYLRCILRRLAG